MIWFLKELLTNSPVLIIAIPLLAAFATPLISKAGDRARNIFVLVILSFTEFLVLFLSWDVFANHVIHVYAFGAGTPSTITMVEKIPIRIIFEVDGMGALMAIASATVTLVGAIYSMAFTKEYTGKDKYYSLLLLMAVGMFGMEFTGDLFNLFVFLEILSISSCALIAFRTERWESPEAAFKFMVISSIAALFVLFSVGIFYGEYDALNIAAIANAMKSAGHITTLDGIALALLVSAFAMKAGSVPMHYWCPDAYMAAPAPITMMLVVASQASLYALFRTCFTLYGITMNVLTIGWIVIAFGLLSMFIGVTMAIPQKDIKRLMSYHAISQTGYMLLGVGVGIATLGASNGGIPPYGLKAMEGGIFHIINHAMYKGLLFLTAGSIFYRIGTRDLNKMGGLGHSMKWTMIFFMIGALAIAGIPPFNGFASKLMIYESVYQFSPILSIIAMLVSILTLASFVKVFHSAFMGPKLPQYENVKEVPQSMLIGMGILAGIIIFFGIFPQLIVNWMIEPAANALVNQAAYIRQVLFGG
jgi:multicomponent Na+:H+ antiporter subunit D